MQLDRSRIAISERSWADNLDLALHVLRSFGGPLLVCGVLAIVPLAVLNHLFLQWLFPDLWAEEETMGILYWIACLVMIEAPLATAPMTLYLGQALFQEKPQPRTVARDFASCLPQLLLLQVLVRVVLVLPVITWILPYAMWPYLNEVILLERNPLVGSGGRLSTLKRNSLLHRGTFADNLVRALGAALLSVLLITAIYMSLDMLGRHLLGLEPSAAGWLVETQLAFWIVAVYFSVVRFLSYLDGRIRNEGWEVELLLRAQRARLTRPVA